MTPTKPQLVEWFLRVERDPQRHAALATGDGLVEQAIRDSLIADEQGAREWFVNAIADLGDRDLITYRWGMHGDGLPSNWGAGLRPHVTRQFELCKDFGSLSGASAMVSSAPTSQTITVHGDVSQLAGRDINNVIAVFQEAERMLETANLSEPERTAAKTRLRGLANALTSASITATPAVAAEAVLHALGVL